jgi:5-methylcytosine-specific restriction endonuclease McrA
MAQSSRHNRQRIGSLGQSRMDVQLKRGWPLDRLRTAQRGICAGCGGQVPRRKRRKHPHPEAPTFDHVVPRSQGGTRALDNGLLKHNRCNSNRGSRPANGCDLIWHAVVLARLGFIQAGQQSQCRSEP